MNPLKTYKVILCISASKDVVVHARGKKQAEAKALAALNSRPKPDWSVDSERGGVPMVDEIEEV
jgi:hypothetical protein